MSRDDRCLARPQDCVVLYVRVAWATWSCRPRGRKTMEEVVLFFREVPRAAFTEELPIPWVSTSHNFCERPIRAYGVDTGFPEHAES